MCGRGGLLTLGQGLASSVNCPAIFVLEFWSIWNESPIALPRGAIYPLSQFCLGGGIGSDQQIRLLVVSDQINCVCSFQLVFLLGRRLPWEGGCSSLLFSIHQAGSTLLTTTPWDADRRVHVAGIQCTHIQIFTTLKKVMMQKVSFMQTGIQFFFSCSSCSSKQRTAVHAELPSS